jgi:hypothetical protein
LRFKGADESPAQQQRRGLSLKRRDRLTPGGFMKKLFLVIGLTLFLSGTCHAFIVDSIITSINNNVEAARQAAHDAFMELKIV